MNAVKLRPKTPVYREINPAQNLAEYRATDKKQLAVIILQRLMRGRAKQNMMFEGKEKRLDLIAELRATEEWKAASDFQEDKALIDNYQERVLDGTAEALQAEVISKTLDNLSKELVRLKQERKIAAMVRIAEDMRRKREAEESGRRQGEAILRQREDVLYQELMSVHQGTVDSYLQNIMINTIDNTSSLQAYQEAKLKADTLNKFIDKMEERRNKPEVLIKDLVSSFLIPDVQRKKLQRQRKYICLYILNHNDYSSIRGKEVLGDSQKDHSEFRRSCQLEARDRANHQKVMSKFNYLKMTQAISLHLLFTTNCHLLC